MVSHIHPQHHLIKIQHEQCLQCHGHVTGWSSPKAAGRCLGFQGKGPVSNLKLYMLDDHQSDFKIKVRNELVVKHANPIHRNKAGMSAKNRCCRKQLGGSSTIKSAPWLTHSLENGEKVRFCGPTDFQTKLHQQLTLHEMYLQIRFPMVPLYWKYYFQYWLYIWEYIWGKTTPLLCKKPQNPSFIFHNTFQVHAEHVYICP